MGNVNNVRIKKTSVKLGGIEYTFFYSLAAAAYLTEKYGSATVAEQKLYSVCFKFNGADFEARSEKELMTTEFFEILRDYVIALTERQQETIDIYSLGVDELPGIITGVLAAIGLGNPDPSQGSTNPQ